MPFRVNDIVPTPNPNAAKFMLDKAIVEQPTSFFDAASARGYPLAEKLFAIPGVQSVLMLGDFITINKRSEADWGDIIERTRQVLTEAA